MTETIQPNHRKDLKRLIEQADLQPITAFLQAVRLGSVWSFSVRQSRTAAVGWRGPEPRRGAFSRKLANWVYVVPH